MLLLNRRVTIFWREKNASLLKTPITDCTEAILFLSFCVFLLSPLGAANKKWFPCKLAFCDRFFQTYFAVRKFP